MMDGWSGKGGPDSIEERRDATSAPRREARSPTASSYVILRSPFALLSPLQDTESISQHQPQLPRATRQKTTHAAPPRPQERIRAAPKPQPQPQSRAEPASHKQTSSPPSPESPTASSAPTTSLSLAPTPAPPTRDELLLGFFHHNATEEGLSYTLCVLPAGDDRTRGEWELYEDFDPAKRSHASTRPAPSTTTRRRTTWSGRWSLRPERDGFGWVELLKTAEAVQENGRTVEQQCLMSQCCPYNVTTECSAADGSRRKVMGIMLNAFDRSGGLFLTRAL